MRLYYQCKNQGFTIDSDAENTVFTKIIHDRSLHRPQLITENHARNHK